jgi:hypothetical protein
MRRNLSAEESIYGESIYEKQLRERIYNLELLGSLLTSCRIHRLQSIWSKGMLRVCLPNDKQRRRQCR